MHINVAYIKGNRITKLQKLYSPPRNLRVGNKSSMLFLEKRLCIGDLLPAQKSIREIIKFISSKLEFMDAMFLICISTYFTLVQTWT